MHRIGLFGGSFDPVHQGHLALADCALRTLRLDQVIWVPAGRAWQKIRGLTDAEHRAAMVSLAIAGEPRYQLSRCEIDRQGPSYTIDTLHQLKAQHPEAQWWLILGQDQYANLHTWHEWQALLAETGLAVAARDGVAPRAPALDAVSHQMVVLPMAPVMVSATRLRQGLATGDNPASFAPGMLPPAVADYIARQRLYQPSGAATQDSTTPRS